MTTTHPLLPAEEDVDAFLDETTRQREAVDAMLNEIAQGSEGAHEDYTNWVETGEIPERLLYLIAPLTPDE